MKELYDALSAQGFHPREVIADGKLHRFKEDQKDDKESAWYIAFQNHTRSNGDLFYVMQFGSWRTGSVFKYQSDKEYTSDDKRYIKDQIAKLRREREQEKLRIQERASSECQTLWESIPFSSDADHPYLRGKGVSGDLGVRAKLGVLYIPLRDEEGRLWSLQRIYSDGKKRYHSGGRVEGCYHVLGDGQADVVFLCEGFATAASVRMATQGTVFVTFSASNLPKVAKALRQKYPEASFVICGDDDRWTKNSAGEPYNPGRERAEEAAKLCMGTAIFPEFKTLERGKTVDFNDLHAIEGLDELKAQLDRAKPEKHYVVPLGYNGANYYLLSNVNQQIQTFSASALGTAAGLNRLQPTAYWESVYPGRTGGVSWQQAADVLMQACHRKGIFREERVRGRGVWIDDGRVIFHIGNKLIYDGEAHPLHRNTLRSKFIYQSEPVLPPIHSEPLSPDECSRLVDASFLIKWKREDAFMLLCGWIAIAPICGALPWRPHVWITGPSGSGKSYLMNDLIFPLLSKHVNFFQGQTTEAGIRQRAGCSTIPVIFDEFETNDEKSSERVKTILELARQASSESDGIVAKGSASGDAMQFKPRFSMLVSSVRTNLVHEEDANRFVLLELTRPDGSNRVEEFERLRTIVNGLGEEYGARLFARMLRLAPNVIESYQVLRKTLSKKFTMRFGQQYGTLLSGYWHLRRDEVITETDAEALCESLSDQLRQDGSVDDQDEMSCLNHLLESLIRTDSLGEKSIGQMIGQAMSEESYWDVLERYGLRVRNNFLYVASNHRQLSSIYSRTKWSGSYAKSLSRIGGAKARAPMWFTSVRKTVRCVAVPLETIIEEYKN